jgi:hypothetical protein
LEQLQQQTGVADARGDSWMGACKKLGMTPLVVQGRWQRGLSSMNTAGVQFAEVEVDTETGFVKVKKVLCVQDGGLIVSKLTCESQLNGGIIGGIGYALYEARVMDAQTGVMLNPNFETTNSPASPFVPEIEIILLTTCRTRRHQSATRHHSHRDRHRQRRRQRPRRPASTACPSRRKVLAALGKANLPPHEGLSVRHRPLPRQRPQTRRRQRRLPAGGNTDFAMMKGISHRAEHPGEHQVAAGFEQEIETSAKTWTIKTMSRWPSWKIMPN